MTVVLPSLQDLYASHQGKVSDKWDLYLDIYNDLLAPLRGLPVRLLEIGVQNGGSLELWSKFFPSHTKIIGVDIDPRCGALKFDNPRIEVLVGSILSPEIVARLKTEADFDIIIDDGSHKSVDILDTVAGYFNRVKLGGLFIIEDMHCDYSRRYRGGPLKTVTAMTGFKRAIVALYGRKGRRSFGRFLDRLTGKSNPSWMTDGSLRGLEFHDSLVVLQKRASGQRSRIGQRIVVGSRSEVEPVVVNLATKY